MDLNKSDEIKLQNAILDYIKFYPRRGFAWPVDNRAQWDEKLKCFRKYTRHHLKGVSDILGVWDKKPLAIECKTPKGIVSDEQKRFMEMITEHGGIAFVARNLNEVIDRLNLY